MGIFLLINFFYIFLKIKLALVPPKPNELDKTYSNCFCFAFNGTKSIPWHSGSISVKFNVGGKIPSFKANIEKIASNAPAAPRACPVADFVDDIDKVFKQLAKTDFTELNSKISPFGVEVP